MSAQSHGVFDACADYAHLCHCPVLRRCGTVVSPRHCRPCSDPIVTKSSATPASIVRAATASEDCTDARGKTSTPCLDKSSKYCSGRSAKEVEQQCRRLNPVTKSSVAFLVVAVAPGLFADTRTELLELRQVGSGSPTEVSPGHRSPASGPNASLERPLSGRCWNDIRSRRWGVLLARLPTSLTAQAHPTPSA